MNPVLFAFLLLAAVGPFVRSCHKTVTEARQSPKVLSDLILAALEESRKSFHYVTNTNPLND